MSNAVGKAREHEKTKRMRDEGKLSSKITRRRQTDDEIRRGILLAIKGRDKMSLTDLARMLRLTVSDWSRLSDIVLELERERKLRVQKFSNGMTIEANSSVEDQSGKPI